MATLRQSAEGSWADPSTATFGLTPVEGNLIIAVISERSGTSAANHDANAGTMSGLTKIESNDIELGDSTYRRSHSVWTKTAGSSEATSASGDDGTGNSKRLTLYEYEFGGSEDQWDLLDSASGDNGTTSSGTTTTSGTTASVSGDMFKFCSGIMKLGGVPANVDATWDNGVDTVDFDGSLASNGMWHHAATDAADTTEEAKESTMTITGDTTNNGLGGIILVYDTIAPAANVEIVIPLAKRLYRKSGVYV